MGLFKSLKDMKTMVEAAPGLIDSAQQLQQNAAAHQLDTPAGAQRYVNSVNAAQFGEPSSDALAPIAGVDLATYVRIVKGIAPSYDTAQLPAVAAMNGVSGSDWELAQRGWGERIQADRALGSHFNKLYTEA